MEIWLGGGWYVDIFMLWVNGNGGIYIVVYFLEEGLSENCQCFWECFVECYFNEECYGVYILVSFDYNFGLIVELGSVDMILIFCNVYNFLMGNYVEKVFNDFYVVLCEGGMLGVVDYCLFLICEQDLQVSFGYVQEVYVIVFVEEVGFELVSFLEVNVNLVDMVDYLFGVWMLVFSCCFVLCGEELAVDFDWVGYDVIGESDCMILFF